MDNQYNNPGGPAAPTSDPNQNPAEPTVPSAPPVSEPPTADVPQVPQAEPQPEIGGGQPGGDAPVV